MKAVYGKVAQVRDVPSLQVSRVIVEIPIEGHVSATTLLYGHSVLVTIAPPTLKGKPYGVIAGEEPDSVEETVPLTDGHDLAGGAMAKLAGIWCNAPMFLEWLNRSHPIEGGYNPDRARALILELCGINSRRELDHSDRARQLFDQYFRRPYREHLALMPEHAT